MCDEPEEHLANTTTLSYNVSIKKGFYSSNYRRSHELRRSFTVLTPKLQTKSMAMPFLYDMAWKLANSWTDSDQDTQLDKLCFVWVSIRQCLKLICCQKSKSKLSDIKKLLNRNWFNRDDSSFSFFTAISSNFERQHFCSIFWQPFFLFFVSEKKTFLLFFSSRSVFFAPKLEHVWRLQFNARPSCCFYSSSNFTTFFGIKRLWSSNFILIMTER